MIGRFGRLVITKCRYYSNILLDISPAAKLDATRLTIKESFITPLEQHSLMEEVELTLGRLKYSYDHWDDVSSI